ncbi:MULTISPECIES: phage GP46 family protein [Marinomonas]|uniref:Phage GP46 family protein n=1 Tax=Marinomonas rhodophyticola TaxID=2992803 RepID=A0ABT3KCN6_9GAMM|nr:phage GP46 family protein [Marinomonas sp. KJ51-3]MCW4628290.1 phage GP46 family protein [Marinomonas sp. KJ51-3]
MSILLDQLKQQLNIIIDGDLVDSSVAELVLISLFTDSRASDSDELPDGSSDLRGWPGDTYSTTPWGGKLWLLKREKLISDVKNLAVKYAENALAWMLVDAGDGIMAKSVSVVGSIPRINTLALTIVITKSDNRTMTVSVSQRWEAQNAV